MEEIRKYCYTGHLTVTREMVIDYLEETEGAIIDPYYEPTDEEWEEAAEHLFKTGTLPLEERVLYRRSSKTRNTVMS